MSLLLLLSALLSALAGVESGVRQTPVSAEQLAVSAVTKVAQVAARSRAAAPFAQTIDLIASRTSVTPLADLQPVVTAPLFLSRLRV